MSPRYRWSETIVEQQDSRRIGRKAEHRSVFGRRSDCTDKQCCCVCARRGLNVYKRGGLDESFDERIDQLNFVVVDCVPQVIVESTAYVPTELFEHARRFVNTVSGDVRIIGTTPEENRCSVDEAIVVLSGVWTEQAAR
ncbi:hypothetical protein HFX_6486 (plasmid) [Haloferax mediterranei ATCC 33500]|uniref:Uncharacterized protein n=1 Tax=Haloferax mediterranei (strain ATCC 33500 / DSM 1411 / JCM 8866 / NBRC 14739 / NCIMB 2177 / R-4) TaxID=523841 RepID=I3RBJ2_HALMT|nr:hypothetical protein HFX_6486 [Haloferax mediterranei ATCC 33500]